MNHQDVILCPHQVRVLTAAGPGAVAVIEVGLRTIAERVSVLSAFSAEPHRDIADVPVGRIICGRWGGEDVVVVRTSEHNWEVNCHGGVAAVTRIMDELIKSGAENWRAGDSSTDDVESAVNATLPRCLTRKTAGLVLAQLTSPVRVLIHAARQTESLAHRQAALDHFARWRSVADHLIEPWNIAFVGPPNAGKSSLINALAGLQRSIVSEIPGTTRDLVEVDIVVEGWSLRLIDTAGIHGSAESEVEVIGMQLSLEILARCDVICLVTDLTSDTPTTTLTDRIAQCHVPVIWLRNKCDLTDTLPASEVISDKSEMLTSCCMDISAVTGKGLSDFLSYLIRLLIPEEPDAGTALLLPGINDFH